MRPWVEIHAMDKWVESGNSTLPACFDVVLGWTKTWIENTINTCDFLKGLNNIKNDWDRIVSAYKVLANTSKTAQDLFLSSIEKEYPNIVDLLKIEFNKSLWVEQKWIAVSKMIAELDDKDPRKVELTALSLAFGHYLANQGGQPWMKKAS